MLRYLLLLAVFCISCGVQVQTSRADASEFKANQEGQKPSLFAVALPSLFHFGEIWLLLDYFTEVMLSIVEELYDRYEVTIGMFDNTASPFSNENDKYAVFIDSNCTI